MTDYFPTRYQALRGSYDERVSSIRRASIAAMKSQDESRMDVVYATVRAALTRSSLGDLGDRERQLREHLAEQLEDLCLSWQRSGQVLHDVEGALTLDDFVSEDAAFADLRDGHALPGLAYIHIGESAGLASSGVQSCFIDGFFTQSARLGEGDGNMLTFTCGFEGSAGEPDELGTLLRASSRVAQAWISHKDIDAEPMLFGDPDLINDPVMHYALTTAAASVRVVAERVRSIAYR
jgi:hypothetical protein